MVSVTIFPFKNCLALFLFFFLTGNTVNLNAQQKQSNILGTLQIEKQLKSKSILVQLNASETIANLLIVLFDPDGKVVYLNNQYKVKNSIHATIPTHELTAGTYRLNISADNETSKQSLKIN